MSLMTMEEERLRVGSIWVRIRTLPLASFYLGYRSNCLEAGEFVQAIEIPRRIPGTVVRAWKISKRYDCDISAVCGAFVLRLDAGRVTHA